MDLYFSATRHLDPATGRWISQDPQRWQAGDDNLYRYVHNNPANAVDPSGLRDPDIEQDAIIDLVPTYRDVTGHAPTATTESLMVRQEQLNKQYQEQRAPDVRVTEEAFTGMASDQLEVAIRSGIFNADKAAEMLRRSLGGKWRVTVTPRPGQSGVYDVLGELIQ